MRRYAATPTTVRCSESWWWKVLKDWLSLLPTADCWQVVTTGRILYHQSMMPNSLTDTSKPRSARFLSPLASHHSPLNRCRRSYRRGCSISTSCLMPVVRSKTSLTSGRNTTADLNSDRNIHYHQAVQVTAAHQNCCNMPTNTICTPSAWQNSGGVSPPRRSCANT